MLGERLKRIREIAGLTHKQVAELAGEGVSASTVGHLETGRNKSGHVDTALAIAKVFGISVEQLVAGPDPEAPAVLAAVNAARERTKVASVEGTV